MNLFLWSYLDQMNSNLESIREQISKIESESLKKKRQSVLDLIKKCPPEQSVSLFSGKAYSKDQKIFSSRIIVLIIGIISLLSFFLYKIMDVISAIMVFFALVIGLIWYTLKPNETSFEIYETGIQLYGNFYPWIAFTAYKVVDTHGDISKILLN